MIEGFILIVCGSILIYLKISKKILNNKEKYDYYIPPDEMKFWGGVTILLLSGLILILKNL